MGPNRLTGVFERFQHWLGESLVRRTTAHVTFALLGIIFVTATISFFSTWYLVRQQQSQELNMTADTVTRRFEDTLGDWSGAVASLARNRVLSNALLDSQGRDQYLQPFLREYDMRIEELLGLTLCDYLGRPLAATGVGDTRCYGESPDYRGLLERKRTVVFLSVEGGRHLLVLVAPVVYPMTNSAEGALVARLDLGAWFEGARHVPAGYRARLHVAGQARALVGSDETVFEPLVVAHPRLPRPVDGLGLELRIGRAESVSPVDIAHLFFAHGIAALVLLALGVYYARRTASHLSRPLLALVDTARGIADGDEGLRADASGLDEIGRLARDFNRMVDRLEASKISLEDEVTRRTAEVIAGESRERNRSQELAAILDAMPALVMVSATPDCQHVQINRALRCLLPSMVDEAGVISLSSLESLDLRHFGTVLAVEDWPLVKTAREGVAIANFACEATAADGRHLDLIGNALPIFRDGQQAGAIAVLTEVTSLRQAEAEVRQQEEHYHRLFDLMPEGLCVSDGDVIHMANFTLARLMGFDHAGELVGQHVLSFVHLEDRPAFSAAQQQLGDSMIQMSPLPFRLIRRDGAFIHAEVVSSLLQLGGRRLVQSIIRDITQRRQAEEQTRLAARVFDSSQDAIFITDAQAQIISVNPVLTERMGYGTADLFGKNPRVLSSGLHDDAYFTNLWRALANTGHWEGEIHNRHKNGGLLAQWISISAVRNQDGGLQHYIAVISDISERRNNTAHLAYLAQHDYLTGLPNRLLLRDRLVQALAAARRDKHEVAVLFADLDGFKSVNDTYGHAVGDKLLKQVAERIREQVRAVDSVCRVGGDEFVILLPEMQDAGLAANVAAKLCECLAYPYTIGTVRIDALSASIGIANFPADGSSIEELLEHADQAMYQAKHAGKNTFAFHGENTAPPISPHPVFH